MSNRLRSILDPLLSRNAPSRTAVTALGTVLLLVLVPLASVQLAERAYADEPKADADVLDEGQGNRRIPGTSHR